MFAVKTENLSYVYSHGTPFERKAINNINLEIEQGEFVGVIGHTGSGKSTLIQHLNGLLKPHSGKVYINGNDIWNPKNDLKKLRFDVGLVFQYPEYQLFEETVYKDIAYGPKNMGLSEKETDESVREAAHAVGIPEDILEKSPFELSGGQKRRAAIAGVIAMRPKILILDEPVAGLDPKGRKKILNQIKKYHEEQKNTVLLISHSMEDIANCATKVLVLNKSEIFMYGKVEKVFSKVNELSSMGLSVPQITNVFNSLKNKGFDVNTGIFTINQARDEILRLLKGGKNA